MINNGKNGYTMRKRNSGKFLILRKCTNIYLLIFNVETFVDNLISGTSVEMTDFSLIFVAIGG